MADIETIKERLGIADVVGSYVTLERAGRNFRARCPFHNERTPSFFVSPERGTYHCFGCDKGGDIFSFVEEFEGVDFYGALKVLAAKAGVALSPADTQGKDEKDRLYQTLEAATAFYEQTLRGGDVARAYLLKRGITEESIATWRLGYAPGEWRALHSFMSARGIGEEALLKAGLLIRADSGRCYDRFRGRIMFPVADSSGRVVAFSARVLPEEVPSPARQEEKPASASGYSAAKYINSPETLLYNKGATLYGLDKAKQYIREADSCVIVEGQMDLVVLHQIGVKNAVATSGTALTGDHLLRLGRFTETVIFAFDGDAAGFAATERALGLALERGMEVRIAHVPQGTDPGELGIRSPEELRERVTGARHAVPFFLTALKEKHTDARRFKMEAGKAVLPIIARMKNRIEQAHFIAEAARAIGVKEEALWEELRAHAARIVTGGSAAPEKTASSSASPTAYPASAKGLGEAKPRSLTIALRLAGIVLGKERSAAAGDFSHKETKKEMEEILGISFDTLIARLGASEREKIIFEAEQAYPAPASDKEVAELMQNLKATILRSRLLRATEELSRAEYARDTATAERVTREINTLMKSLS